MAALMLFNLLQKLAIIKLLFSEYILLHNVLGPILSDPGDVSTSDVRMAVVLVLIRESGTYNGWTISRGTTFRNNSSNGPNKVA
jgi:hypothetical protein